ncbi:MAG: hypothetical protein KA163_06740 [Bacteroidia bacterium]|nr:hypothetical protein [Bacteroidia bacterium]
MENQLLFEEKQYMGHNRLSIFWRMVLAVFCFIGYYWSENPKPVQVSVFYIGSYPIDHIPNSGKVFFLLGLIILIISALLTYILHIHTRVYKGYMIIDGFLGARKVKIDFSTVTYLRKGRYKYNIFRRAVYNLHSKGIIRFYTSGQEFIELKDNAGFTYRIGTQRSEELLNLIKPNVNS